MEIECLANRSLYGGTISCPVCASTIISTVDSGFESATGLIHHYWVCEDCARMSETLVRID